MSRDYSKTKYNQVKQHHQLSGASACISIGPRQLTWVSRQRRLRRRSASAAAAPEPMTLPLPSTASGFVCYTMQHRLVRYVGYKGLFGSVAIHWIVLDIHFFGGYLVYGLGEELG
jgi:hypothetical protein